MMFLVRMTGHQPAWPDRPDVRVVLRRRTPALNAIARPAGGLDLFCVGDDSAANDLRADGYDVIALHDGWYEDDVQGGVAVWGQGRYWEVRRTPFEVSESG